MVSLKEDCLSSNAGKTLPTGGMVLGIDATNIRGGGGLTHLKELLRASCPPIYGFHKVCVWGPQATLGSIDDRPWLIKKHDHVFERHYLRRGLWQQRRLGDLARREHCDLLFAPGGNIVTDFHPVVTMSQNLLPFMWRELFRYGLSSMTLRLLLLRWFQSSSFRRAAGTIFLTMYARDVVRSATGPRVGLNAVIPHGVDESFAKAPRPQVSITDYSNERPYRILYVSTIEPYKHPWNVAEAVARLNGRGLPVVLDLVGPAYPASLRRLRKVLQRVDPQKSLIRYEGNIAHGSLPLRYQSADLFVFASSCETMGIILLEAMASGLPIASSGRGPMPEVLGDAGVYFDPEKVDSIEAAIEDLIASPDMRTRKALASFERAKQHSWERTANETFEFLAKIAVYSDTIGIRNEQLTPSTSNLKTPQTVF